MAGSFQIVVISGPSGSGKSTIVDRLIAGCNVRLREAVSATTRPRRTGEIDGEDYHFLTTQEFNSKREAGEFLECAEVHGQGFWYGTLKSELDRCQSADCWAVLEIDVEGAGNVMAAYPDAVTIFVKTPSDEEFERRLRARGTESEAEIARRLQTAEEELKQADRYRLQVVNDDLDRVTEDICRFLSNQQ